MKDIIYSFLAGLMLCGIFFHCSGPSEDDTAPVQDIIISTKIHDKREKLTTLSRYIPMQSMILDSYYIIRREKTSGIEKYTPVTIIAKILVPKSTIGNWLCGLQPSDERELPLTLWNGVGSSKKWNLKSPPRFYKSRDSKKNVVLFRDDGIVYLLFKISMENRSILYPLRI